MLYIPPLFKVEDQERKIEFIKQYSFATLISVDCNSIRHLSKIPLLLKLIDEQIYLEGHLARTNPHWKFIEEKHSQVVAMFDGPHDYVSPTEYLNPILNVPTWNYSTVVVSGDCKIIDSQEWLMQSTMELADKYEKDDSWKIKLDKNFANNLAKGIIGLKIKVQGMEGKFKLSQNRDKQSRLNVIKHFENTNPDLANEMKKI